MKVLVINCGSSSLKYQLIDAENENILAKGLCERIGLDGRLVHTPEGGSKMKIDIAMPDHQVAIQVVLDALVNAEYGVIASLDEIGAIGHRVVHGGEKFSSSVLINDEVLAAIEECVDLAPLHNPANLIGIRACANLMPGVPQAAVFDTAFHQTMPDHAYLYGLPLEYYEKYKVRRYGFHGTSHGYVSGRAYEFLGLDKENSKVITCHLGNGSSITAIKDGKSVDTSMGFTPLEGVPMGTRSGDIDPAILEFLAKKENLDINGLVNVLNKKSGVYGISGYLSSDFRDLELAEEDGNELAARAYKVFMYKVAKYVGSYAAAMNGVDAIVFCGGLGENDARLREVVCSYLTYLGLSFNSEANKVRGGEHVISNPDSKVKVAVIETNEELAIARQTVALL